MVETIGAVLPSALGIVISPVPVIAVVLMLMSPQAKSTGAGFLGGWLAGIAGATVLVATLVSALPDSSGENTLASVLRIVLGLVLVALAVRSFRSPGGPEDLPGWMSAVDSMSGRRALLLGAGLAAFNPKNLVMVVAAADSVAAAGSSPAETLATLGVFVVLAGASVALPVLAHAAAPQRVAAPLARLKEWLVQHNSSVMGTLLVVLGVVLVSQGLRTV
ncbi:GAP family protein [Aeromicrobium sp.]|uniref:GAP family protein n=1 Tax=Aeromicrobium sp. TaxID=1871063 RepID=UPI0028A748D9|nr:GAP family protein [Aeromicrobium sp.]